MTVNFPKRFPIMFAILAVALGGCQTIGSGTSSVTCETMTFVYLSRKDTAGTIKQVVPNNAAWVAACGKPKKP